MKKPNFYVINYHKGDPALVVRVRDGWRYFKTANCFDEGEIGTMEEISEEVFLNGRYLVENHNGRTPEKGDIANFELEYAHLRFNFIGSDTLEIENKKTILKGFKIDEEEEEQRVKGSCVF